MIIVRYLIRETVKTQLAVIFVLFLVFFSQKFIRVLAEATDGSIPASEILQLVVLYMPSMAMLMLPLSLYIGILLTFGRLYAESEITVMNATGIGNQILIRSALYLALITGAVAAFNSFWLTPWANQKETQVLEQLEAASGLELIVQGQIQTSPDGQVVIYVSDISRDKKKLEKIFIAQPVPRGTLKPNVITAESGFVEFLPDGSQILQLNNGVRYEGLPTRLDYDITQYDNYRVLIGKRDVRPRDNQLDAKPTLDLFDDNSPKAQAELQWRISLLLCIPLMTMIVVPLSAVNPRQGRFAKLIPAILIYLSYFLALSALKSAVEEGTFPVYPGLWLVNIVTAMVGFGLLSWDSMPVRKFRYKERKAHV